ncbi:SsrA-binding protein SmpB [Buchnera aphidicola (Formosaphis micheliae)]|uniref:SsrA-binding protein SmpB n=1 Tax=Buchnera aphidicola TaxID=9 RepID=UPI0031B840D2
MTKKCISHNKLIIVKNKKCYYNYKIIDEFESGLILLGWEIKSIRAKKVSINNSYVLFHDNEAYLFGSNFQPVFTITKHINCEPIRNRKLLLHRKEIDFMIGKMNKERYSIIALSLYWKKNLCKLKIGMGIGKSKFDKRMYEKNNAWKLEKNRILKNKKNS